MQIIAYQLPNKNIGSKGHLKNSAVCMIFHILTVITIFQFVPIW